MRFKQFILAGALALFGALPAVAQWSDQSIEAGARDHPVIVAKYGGAVSEGELTAYVNEIGQKMARLTGQAGSGWTFTVLDSPKINAFALPAGYVYVTRGLLALAHNEAELAAVLAHEITHVVENHVEKRQEAQSSAVIDGAVGALVGSIFGSGSVDDAIRENIESTLAEIGHYSQEQEFAADAGGIALLKLAGYDPMAQVTFLQAMADDAALRALIAGREYDSEKVPFFANHPAPAERLTRAAELAGDGGGRLATDRYLRHLDGMLYGQDTRQGIMRDGQFIHPVLGFTFDVAAGLRLQNSARQINILGARGATLVLSGAPIPSQNLRDYVQEWARQIPRRQRIGHRISDQRSFQVNGMPAASATIRMRRGARRGDLTLTVIAMDHRLYRFAGFVPDRSNGTAQRFEQTVRSFRRLSSVEVADLHNTVLIVRRVTAVDRLDSLLAGFPDQSYVQARFALLNRLAPGEMPEMGSLVKLLGVETP